MDVKEKIPDVSIGTDVIAGFPGETDEDFEQTVEVIKKLPFSYLHVFEYSDREGTEAYYMRNKVSPIVKKERVRKLLEIAKNKKLEFLKTQIGKIREAMIEREANSNYLVGTTDNYIKILLPRKELPQGKNLPLYTPVLLKELRYPYLLASLVPDS